MTGLHSLMTKRDRLTRQVQYHLDFLVGSVSTKGLKYPAFNLTTKVKGKTVTRHIPKDLVPVVRRMAARHKKLKTILQSLAEVNWELVCQGVELRDYGSV
jgi:hypothetical protein